MRSKRRLSQLSTGALPPLQLCDESCSLQPRHRCPSPQPVLTDHLQRHRSINPLLPLPQPKSVCTRYMYDSHPAASRPSLAASFESAVLLPSKRTQPTAPTTLCPCHHHLRRVSPVSVVTKNTIIDIHASSTSWIARCDRVCWCHHRCCCRCCCCCASSACPTSTHCSRGAPLPPTGWAKPITFYCKLCAYLVMKFRHKCTLYA